MTDAIEPKTNSLPRALALDLDGTLLNSDGQLSAENQLALKKLKEKGVEIILASGRMTPTILPFCHQLNFPLTVISYNGSKLLSYLPNSPAQVHISHHLSSEAIQEILNLCQNWGYFANIYENEDLYGYHVHEDYSFKEFYANQTGSIYKLTTNQLKELPTSNITKILIISPTGQRDAIYRQVSSTLKIPVQIIKSQPEYVEFTRLGVTKAKTLGEFLASKNIPSQECMAMGDAENDLEMLNYVGYGIAVKNASSGLKEKFQKISLYTNNENAVAQEILNYFY